MKTCRVGLFHRSRSHVKIRSINVQILITQTQPKFWVHVFLKAQRISFQIHDSNQLSWIDHQ